MLRSVVLTLASLATLPLVAAPVSGTAGAAAIAPADAGTSSIVGRMMVTGATGEINPVFWTLDT